MAVSYHTWGELADRLDKYAEAAGAQGISDGLDVAIRTAAQGLRVLSAAISEDAREKIGGYLQVE